MVVARSAGRDTAHRAKLSARDAGCGPQREGERMRVLITGSAGQLGRALAESLADARLAGADVSARGVDSAEMDITSAAAVGTVFGEFEPDIVINCAAYTAVDAAEADEDSARAVNAEGPAILARATAAAGARLIHVSTDYVFDGGDSASVDRRPYAADAPTAPRTAYGRTKLAGEQAVRRLDPAAHIVRSAWVYTGAGTDFVATMRLLEGERETITVVDDQRGSPTYVADLAAGLVELAWLSHASGRRMPGLLLHATNAGEATWFELARAVFEEIGADPARVRPCPSTEFPRPAPRPAYSVLSGREWLAAGLTPLRDWRTALRDALSTARST